MTGSPTRPTGVFRARHGRLTISASGVRSIVARFEMDAVGFLASEPDHEDRELRVKGSFTAPPSRHNHRRGTSECYTVTLSKKNPTELRPRQQPSLG